MFEFTDLFTNTQNLIALVVGFIGILLTFITLIWQRKHDRLTLLPIPNVAINDSHNELTIDLENNGLGPLIIKSITFTMDNEKTWNKWPPGDTFASCLNKLVSITTVLRENSVIVSQQKERLFSCKYNPSDNDQKVELSSLIDNFKKINVMKIEYTDIFNKNKTPAWWRLTPISEEYPVKISNYKIWDDLKEFYEMN